MATLLTLCQMAFAQDLPPKNTITWFINDLPPYLDVRGSLPGQGIIDASLRYVVAHMPEYEHRFEVSINARSLGLMAQGELVCQPGLLETAERRKTIEFSLPVVFDSTHHVVLRRERLPRFLPYLDKQGHIQLDKLLADENLTLSVTEHRSFVVPINEALARVKGHKNILLAGTMNASPILQMAAGWVDYVIAYPTEIGWYQARQRILQELELVHLPIANLPEYAVAYFGCTKGNWGQKIIRQINDILRAAGPRPPWFEYQLSLVDAPNARRLEGILQRHQPLKR